MQSYLPKNYYFTLIIFQIQVIFNRNDDENVRNYSSHSRTLNKKMPKNGKLEPIFSNSNGGTHYFKFKCTNFNLFGSKYYSKRKFNTCLFRNLTNFDKINSQN